VVSNETSRPGAESGPRQKILVYSSDSTVRASVLAAIGRRAAADLPLVAITECATQAAVLSEIDGGGYDLAILDGEAAPSGGMGICRQLKDEIYKGPPVLVLIGRPQDAWLAAWSRADGVISHPLDPFAITNAVAPLLRSRSTAARV
jgi:DNA-binding response OmpR family regulator